VVLGPSYVHLSTKAGSDAGLNSESSWMKGRSSGKKGKETMAINGTVVGWGGGSGDSRNWPAVYPNLNGSTGGRRKSSLIVLSLEDRPVQRRGITSFFRQRRPSNNVWTGPRLTRISTSDLPFKKGEKNGRGSGPAKITVKSPGRGIRTCPANEGE